MTIVNPKWATSPRPVLVSNLSNLKKGSVLDLGCSDGVNDIYLAENGFNVTCVDKDTEALETLRKEVSENNLQITAVQADLNNYKIESVFDNIITFFTLHFLHKDVAIELINQMKQNTSSGGINLIVTFTDSGEFEMGSDYFYPTSAEIETIYSGWEILNKTTEIGKMRSGELQEITYFIARKKL